MSRKHSRLVLSLPLGLLVLGSLAALGAASGLRGFSSASDCPEQAEAIQRAEPGFVGFGDEDLPACAKHRSRKVQPAR